MPRYSGINRDYSGRKEDPKSTQEERDRLMKEFLEKINTYVWSHIEMKLKK